MAGPATPVLEVNGPPAAPGEAGEGVTPAREGALGKRVGLAMGWTILNTVLTKGLSLAAFATMGWLLGEQDFGLFAMATAIAGFVQIFRDGGVVQLLVQRGPAAYAENLGPVFWMALAFNGATALVLSAAALPLERAFGQPGLAALLWVIAGWNLAATPGVVLSARLQMDLRFERLVRIAVISAVIRYGTMIALGASGFGALSFVLPLPLIAVFEWWAAWRTTGDRPWARAAQTGRWRGLFAESRWLVLVALSAAVINQGTPLVLGALVSVAVLGAYGFANMLVSQVDALLVATSGVVFLPALSRLKDEPERLRAALLRGMKLLTLLAAPAALGLAVGASALERLVWQGKWAGSVVPLQLLAAVYVLRVLLPLPTTAMLACGRFSACALWVTLYGLATAAGAAAGALIRGDALGIAAGFAAATLGPGLVILVQSCKVMGLGRRVVAGAILPTLALGACAAGVCVLATPLVGLAGAWVGEQAAVLAGSGGGGGDGGGAAGLAARIKIHVGAGMELALLGLVFAGVYGGLLRALTPGVLAEALGVLPGFAARPAARVLRLPPG